MEIMKQRIIELRDLKGNVLHFSSSRPEHDFTKDSIVIRITFDNDTDALVAGNSGSIILNTPGQRFRSVFIVDNLGNSAVIELTGLDQEVLDSIQVADEHIDYLNFGDVSGVTSVIQAFIESVGMRGYWGITFFNRENAMHALRNISMIHYQVLDDFIRAYITRQEIRNNRKKLIRDRTSWIAEDLQSRTTLNAAWVNLQNFCAANNISLDGIIVY